MHYTYICVFVYIYIYLSILLSVSPLRMWVLWGQVFLARMVPRTVLSTNLVLNRDLLNEWRGERGALGWGTPVRVVSEKTTPVYTNYTRTTYASPLSSDISLNIPSIPPVQPLTWSSKAPVPALTLQGASCLRVSFFSNLLSPLLIPGTGLGQ